MVSQSAITPMHVRFTKRMIELQGDAADGVRNVVGIGRACWSCKGDVICNEAFVPMHCRKVR